MAFQQIDLEHVQSHPSISSTTSKRTLENARERAVKNAYIRARNWQYAQVAAFTVLCVLSMVTYVTLSYANGTFSPECVLGANWAAVREGPKPGEWTLSVDQIKWGNLEWCDFTQYSFAASTIASFMLGWFFILFRPVEKSFRNR